MKETEPLLPRSFGGVQSAGNGAEAQADLIVDTKKRNPKLSRRLTSIDMMRGFIMVFMAWDHTKDFVSKYQGKDLTNPDGSGPYMGGHSEGWAGPVELWHGSPVYYLSRFVSHFCAPGFAFLMGVGMVLLSESRRSKLQWSEWRLIRFFELRGFVLVVLGFAIRCSLWLQLIYPTKRFKNYYKSKGNPVEHFALDFYQVMTCLGLQMMVLGLLLSGLHRLEVAFGLGEWRLKFGRSDFLSFGFRPVVLFLLGVACFVTTSLVIHHEQRGDPGAVEYPGTAVSFKRVLLRFVVLPGGFGSLNAMMAYPVVPWLALSLWGCAAGFEFRHNPEQAHWRALLHGIAYLVAFVAIRLVGGKTLNFRGLPIGEGKNHPWVAFWALCKYPPSLGYVSITMGMVQTLLFVFSHSGTTSWPARILLTFGKSPLAFYISHFWLINLAALLGSLATNRGPGLALPWVIPVWLSILTVEFFLCRLYGRFKATKGPDSLWRLL